MAISGVVFFIFVVVVLVLLSILSKKHRKRDQQISYNIAEESTRSVNKKSSKLNQDDAEVAVEAPPMPPSLLKDYIHIIMPVIISLVIIGFGLILILRDDIPKETKNWIFGAMGSVIGYWLKN